MQVQINKLDFSGQNIFIGIDAHKKQWKNSIMVENVFYKTISQPSDPKALSNYLRKNFPGGNYFSAYEAGFCGFWPHYQLEELGIKSIVVNPSDIPTSDKERRQKEDKRDSRKIAKALQSNILEGIYIPQKKTLEDRMLVRYRFTFVKELNRFKNRIKAILNFYGIKYPDEFSGTNSHWSKRFIDWLESIKFDEASAKLAFKTIIDQCKYLRRCLLDINRQIRELSKTEAYNKNVKLLTSIHGIGLIISMVLLTELETIDRFKKLDQLCSFIGIVPSTNSSGENDKAGDITPRSHKLLRSLLVEASWVAIRHDPVLLLSYTKYSKRMEPNMAIIRIVKKMLNRIRYVLKNEQEYVIATVK